MNTKTMRLPPRRLLTSNKRKEKEGFFDSLKPSPPKLLKPTTVPQPGSPPPVSSNHLLAGYLAHEYLTKGTLFGQQWDPARVEGVPLLAEPKKNKPGHKAKEVEVEAEPNKDNYVRYVEVSRLLKDEGAHLPGVVNPSQLARFLQM